MKQQKISGLKKRDELVSNLINNYKNNSAEKITIISGPSGSGKSYIVNKILDECRNRFSKNKICAYVNFEGAFIQPNERHSSRNISDLSLSLNYSIISFGIGIGIENEDFEPGAAKILDSAKNSTVLVCVDDFSNSDPAIKHILKVLFKKLNRLGENFSQRIYFLITDSEEETIHNFFIETASVEDILLLPYTKDDIIQYLKDKHLNLLVSDNFNRNLDCIEKISNGDLSIVDFLFVDITFQNSDFFESLERVVNHRLLQIKKSGLQKDISESMIEDIILSSSLSLQKFSSSNISYITERENNLVVTGLHIAEDNDIIEKDLENYYQFNCSEVKKILYNQSVEKRSDRLLYYYKYYTENEPDEYYFRAYYITVYFHEITAQAFALLALSLIYSIKLGDDMQLSKIYELVHSYDLSNYLGKLDDIKEFYIMLNETDSSIESLNNMFKKIKNDGNELPLLAEVTRAYFQFLYQNAEPSTETLGILLENCIEFAQNPLQLSAFKNPIGLKPVDEIIVRCNVIYTIAPYLLDVQNDVTRFDKVFRISRELLRNGLGNRNNGIAQYIENVFNRKAFLYANPTQCDVYYEKAKNYFKHNNIWGEYCITLICQAGTNIVIQQFDESLGLCKKAIDIAEEKNISIPQISKLYNNQLIADFLKTEKEAKNEKIRLSKARKTALTLQKQLHNTPCATEFVIITNICSLSLYYGDDNKYKKYKAKLEKLMNCLDVADVNDENIDDFYRYYFSWFEVFRAIRDLDWEKAKKLSISLKDMVPSLFKKQEIFCEKKYQALIDVIEKQIPVSAYDFCLNLVKTSRRETVLSRFYCRGLMLSDLQYTSIS